MKTANRSGLLLALAYLGFVSLGLPDGVLGLVWPSLRAEFGLPQAALGAPLAVGTITYFAAGLFAGKLTRSLGVGLLLSASTALVGLSVFGFALAPAFAVFLLAAAIMGFGSGAIDASLNTYAAQNFRARHMSWLHAAYSLGAASGPAIATALLVRGAGWRSSYFVIACALSCLAIAFAFTRRRWSPVAERDPARPARPAASSAWAALADRRVVVSSLLFFAYTGVEVGAGQWSYTVLTQGRGMSTVSAGLFVTAYWVSLLAGRVLSGFIVERVGTARLVRAGAAGAGLAAVVFAWPGLTWSAAALPWIGLCLAPIFPGLMSETPRRVGAAAAAHAVGFQVSAATAGVAVLPNVAGLLGQSLGLSAIASFTALVALLMFGLHELLVRLADR